MKNNRKITMASGIAIFRCIHIHAVALSSKIMKGKEANKPRIRV